MTNTGILNVNSSNQKSIVPLYGKRGEEFRSFIRRALSFSHLQEHLYDLILTDEGLELYDQAFTHRTIHPQQNYEIFEFLGDVTVNKCIAWYLCKRFPHLMRPEGVKILTRIKSNLISKKSLASFAKQLHFWDFVSASTEIRTMKMDKTLEDVFEAFIAVTEILVDKLIKQGAGFCVCYRLISNLLDTREISLSYETLFDAKTRIKEIFDYFGSKLGTLKYEVKSLDRFHHISATVRLPDGEVKFLGKGSAPIKVDAEQKASEEAIKTLSIMGFTKPLSDDYKMFFE